MLAGRISYQQFQTINMVNIYIITIFFFKPPDYCPLFCECKNTLNRANPVAIYRIKMK